MKPYYKDEWVTIYRGDCREILPELPKVDLVLTSPPYENIMGAGYKMQSKDILFFKLYSEFLDSFLGECYRVLKDNGQLFLNIKSDVHNRRLITPHWIEFTEAFQRFDFKSYIIWKYAGSFDSTDKRLHLDYEIIYHLSNGDNICLNNDGGKDPLTSVWYIPHNIKGRLHPTQMPEGVAKKIIELASNAGDIILDPFLGSGTTAYCAKKLNRECIGIEIKERYCEISANRCRQMVMNLRI